MAGKRTIVVGVRRFWWTLTPSDDGLRIVARASDARGGRTMAMLYDHGNLVTPWLVRRAIEHALANGWDPDERGPQLGFVTRGVVEDRRVDPVAHLPPAERERALIDQIADLGDDASRSVYADWLLEHDDPRGELIVLASATELDADDKKRLAELESQRDGWLGPIVDVTRVRWWKSGMFDACQLGKRAPGAVDRALGHAGWQTVTRIDGLGAFMTPEDVARTVAQPALRSLRHLTIDPEVVRLLATGGAELGRLGSLVIGFHPRDAVSPSVLAELEAHLPALRRVTLHVPDARDLVAILATTRACRLIVQDPTFDVFANGFPRYVDAPAAAHVEEIRFVQMAHGSTPPGAQLGLARAADGRWTELTVGWGGVDWEHGRTVLLAGLEALPRNVLTRVTIDSGPAPLDDAAFVRRVRAALARQSVAR